MRIMWVSRASQCGSAGCRVVVRVAGVCGCGEGRHSPQEASMSGEAVSRGLVGGVSLRY